MTARQRPRREPPVTPIFVLSLPRSGSTLMQRMIARHASIATSSEPWLMIPLLTALQGDVIYASFSHYTAREALEDFCGELPDGTQSFYDAARRFGLDLYAEASGGEAPYFLDKTPRYFLIAEELIRTFPDAKFVFLWRNPLAIAASIIETFGRGHWNINKYRIDLYEGVDALLAASERLGDAAHHVHFEELVQHPDEVASGVFSFLGLDPDEVRTSDFTEVRLSGRMGDKTGTERYNRVAVEPLSKWQQVLANPLRKQWANSYLDWLGPERLRRIGYDRETVRAQLRAAGPSTDNLGSDLLRRPAGMLWYALELDQLYNKWLAFRRGERLVTHT